MTTTATAQTTQVYSIFIRATAEEVWDAITKPEFTSKYFFGNRVDSTFEPGAPFRSLSPDGAEVRVEGVVREADRPRRLVHGWRALYNAETAAEPESRVTWEIEPQEGGVCRLTVVHDELEHAPKTAGSVAGGWMYVLSGLKTLLETGQPLSA